MKALIRTGLTAGASVSDEYLSAVHPQLPLEFREHLLRGWQMYLDGLENSDPQLQATGIEIIHLWLRFKDANSDLLYNRLIE